MIDAGLQLTFGGFAVGGHIIYGRDNGQWSLQPKGGHEHVRRADRRVVHARLERRSASMCFSTEDAGSGPTRTRPGPGANVGKVRNQFGVAVGDTFTLAPGAFLFMTYLYGTRHQAGVDLLSGTTSGTSIGEWFCQDATTTPARRRFSSARCSAGKLILA